MSELQFNAAGHEYSVGGVVLPSVTEILKATGIADDFSGVDAYYADRGHRVHEVVAAALLGFGLRISDSDEMQFAESFREFRNYYDPEPLYVEHRMHDLEPPVAGTVDFIGTLPGALNGDMWVLDWKAGDYRSYYATQAAAYFALARLEGVNVERAGVVSLKENPPRIREVDLDVQLVIWRHALEKYHGGS